MSHGLQYKRDFYWNWNCSALGRKTNQGSGRAGEGRLFSWSLSDQNFYLKIYFPKTCFSDELYMEDLGLYICCSLLGLHSYSHSSQTTVVFSDVFLKDIGSHQTFGIGICIVPWPLCIVTYIALWHQGSDMDCIPTPILRCILYHNKGPDSTQPSLFLCTKHQVQVCVLWRKLMTAHNKAFSVDMLHPSICVRVVKTFISGHYIHLHGKKWVSSHSPLSFTFYFSLNSCSAHFRIQRESGNEEMPQKKTARDF